MHVTKKQPSESSLVPSSMSSVQTHGGSSMSTTSLNHHQFSSLTSHSEESEQSFTVSTAGDIYRGASLDQNITHQSIDSGIPSNSWVHKKSEIT